MNGHYEEKRVRTVCGLYDGNTCGLTAHVKDGRITKVTPGDFPEVMFKGACAKGLSAHHWAYHAERLHRPLKRAGKRGEGKWLEVSWEEASQGIAGQLKEISEKHGSTSIAWSTPDYPYLKQGGYSRLISLTKGARVKNEGYGDLAGPTADFLTFGWMMGEFYSSHIIDPRLAIVWGYNPAYTSNLRMREIAEARKKGCRVVVIDPRKSATASKADEHIPLRPGTDGALALGMIHVVLKEKLQDEQCILENTVGPFLVRSYDGSFLRENQVDPGGDEKGFMVWDKVSGRPRRHDEPGLDPALQGEYVCSGTLCRPAFALLSGMVMEFTPERVSEITDIPSETVYRLALQYAKEKPAAIHRGWGLQRSFYGDLTCRAINTLAAVTGNMNMERRSSFVLNKRPFLMPAGVYTEIPIMMLYPAITQGEPFPVKALCFMGHNFVNQLPNANRIVKELFPKLELILVADLFMTATAEHADYVLPAASFLECSDLVVGMYPQMPYLQLQQKVIEPLYDCKSDFDIAAELGRAMGLGGYFDKGEETYISEILASGHPTMEGVTLDRLKEGPARARDMKRAQRLTTPTGKIEFYVEGLRRFGQALPVYMEPVESVRTELSERFSLCLLTPHAKYRVHSTMVNVPEMLKFDPEPVLEMNPVDAESRNITDQEVVWVYNDRGQVKVKVRVTPDIKPGVLSLEQGWWPEHYMEGHHNQLTHEKINPAQEATLGPNAAYYDVLVEVKKST